jgi:hypothetical protein
MGNTPVTWVLIGEHFQTFLTGWHSCTRGIYLNNIYKCICILYIYIYMWVNSRMGAGEVTPQTERFPSPKMSSLSHQKEELLNKITQSNAYLSCKS